MPVKSEKTIAQGPPSTMAQNNAKSSTPDSSTLRSLRATLFRFTVAPALALAITLALVFTLQQMHDRRQLLLSHGHASAEQLAELIAMSGGQPIELRMEWLRKSLLALMLEKDMVRSVHIYSTEASEKRPLNPNTGLGLLASVGPRPATPITREHLQKREPFIFEDEESLQILQPLKGDILTCWISIELHRPYFLVGTYQVLLIGLVGLIICTLAAVAWSVILSERFALSLSRMGQVLQAVGRGEFDRRARETGNREVAQMANQINEMAKNLANYQRDYKANLLQSMDDLRQSLDSMEEQNIELDLARKRAQEASRIKSTFLANTSHEIRTPLNGIIGFTNLLLKTEVDELQQDYLQTILRSSENLLTTINDILDFSRIESGNLVLDHIPMDLGQLLEETLQILAPYAYEHHLELVPLIDSRLPATQVGDPLRTKQILTNLLGNAIRSSENGNIPVQLNVVSSKDSELVLRISVTDLGNRIDEAGRSELQQILNTKTPQHSQQISANGLGMSIARSLVERMRGSTGIEEADSGGSHCWVQLSLQPERNRGVPPRFQCPGCRILIADPNHLTRTQVAQLLSHWQAEPVELSDTETLQPVIEQMWRHDALPDAVIIDTAIAKGDFDSFSVQVQSLVDAYQCQVIVLGAPAELRRCYEQLRTRTLTFLGKPVTRENLLRALKRAAPRRNQQRPSSGAIPALPWPATPRILAVDDHAANRRLVGELLRTQDIEVVIAASGEEALQHWQQSTFDLIFMDIQMPGMDGIEATRRIREQEAGRRTPIIALTAHAGAEEKARLLSAGLDDYLSKPVSEAQLTHMIKRWIKIITPQVVEKLSLEQMRLVDIGESLTLANGDMKLARDMLQMLLDGLVCDERELQRLLSTGDLKDMFELTHRMHGGCCYCGVARLREATCVLQEELRTLQEREPAEFDRRKLDAVFREMRALREWASEQNLDALFGLEVA